jgi:hypothetical protein
MNWNIFKRIAELETRVAALSLQVIQNGLAIDDLENKDNAVTVEQFPIIIDYGRAVVKGEGQPIPMTESELKRERLAQSKREYYQRNREQILAKQRAKKRDEERKRKSREYAKKYYAKKKAAAQAKPVDQPRFIVAA